MNWSEYNRISRQNVESGGQEPSVIKYAFIKIFDHTLIIIAVILMLIFLGTAIYLDQINRGDMSKIAIHAFELCFGFTIGSLIGKK